MAEMDSRAYHRSLISDANNVAERILQPMSLPWTHKVVPVARNIPCDIDEMIDVVTADDGSHTPFDNGNFGFGQFETGRTSGDSLIRFANSSKNFRAASRRSLDPGTIQLSTIALPSSLCSYQPGRLSMVRSRVPVGSHTYREDERLLEGETALRCFELMLEQKRRKTVQARSCVASFEISVKINSSSSRSSIFTNLSKKRKLDNDAIPLVLDAILPLEVENGRRMNKARAKIATEKLGSYDIRHGTPSIHSGKNTGRALVGRTRLMWTSKRSSEQSQRVCFTSLITGQQLENNAEKRPRNIRVCVKVDGDILRSPKTDHAKLGIGIDLQTTLQCDQLVRNLLDSKHYKQNFPYFKPPLIECVPDSTGSIHVVCTSPGAILQSSINPILKLAGNTSNPRCTVCWRSTHGGLEVKKCVKCGLLAHVECCLDPGELRVLCTGDCYRRREEWICSVCCHHDKSPARMYEASLTSQKAIATKKSKRKSKPPRRLEDPHFESMKSQKTDHSTLCEVKDQEIKCAVCNISGGAMSCISSEGEAFWVHEICRIWTSDQRFSSSSRNEKCVLCAASYTEPVDFRYREGATAEHPSKKQYSSRHVVKCAATGCHISVHPMCASISSLTSRLQDEASQVSGNVILDDIEKAKKNDIKLCSQYTLTFASICGPAHSFGKDPGQKYSSFLPVFFCGIHNPAREEIFYGLNPGGNLKGKGETLRVPSC